MKRPLLLFGLLALTTASTAVAGPGGGGAISPPDDAEETALPPMTLFEAEAATYHGQVSPLVFRVSAGSRTPAERAKEATAALESALDHGGETEGEAHDGQAADSREVTVRVETGAAIVRIGPHVITSYYPEDAAAEGLPLETFAAQVGTELTGFVPTQLTRRSIQLFALHVFLSVFAIVIAFVALRELRKLFDRWDEALDEKKGKLPAISVLRIPIISGEALGGFLGGSLAFGRIAAYLVAVAAAVATVLGQFESTRPLLRRLGKLTTQPLVDGFEAVLSAIPGLLLAAALVVGLRAALRVMNLLLDGVAGKQIEWRFLPPRRVPLFRSVVPVLAVVIIAPLLVAAAFGQFGTPLETLALLAGGASLVATVPVLASWVVGSLMLWTGQVQAGHWIEVGGFAGEVTQVTFSEIKLVPEEGGTLSVPNLYLLLHPLRHLRAAPAVSFEVLVARDKERSTKELLEAVAACIHAKEEDAKVELIDIGRSSLAVRVLAPSTRAGVRQALLVALADGADQGTFELLGGAERERATR